MSNFVLLGYSGHGRVIENIIYENNDKLIGYFDKTKSKINSRNLEYLGLESVERLKHLEDIYIFPAIADNATRSKLIKKIKGAKAKTTCLISKDAVIKENVSIDVLTLIMSKSLINVNTRIGEGVIINTGAIIEHDVIIGNCVHVAPGAVVLGNVKVGDYTFIGANATIRNNINIGANSTIGAGSVVLKDIGNNETWVGNPAKRIK